MKKIISVVLALTMLFICITPAFAEDNERPTIYITGQRTNNILDKDGKQIFPLTESVDAMAVVKENLKPCLKKLAHGILTNNYTEYAEELRDIILEYFGSYILDKNGETSNGTHPKYDAYTYKVPEKTANYKVWDYRFWYDWRISPMSVADDLKAYIDRVIEATGEDKVNLMGRCYGANVITAYFSKYEEHALQYVDDIAYLSSSADGIDMLGALFTGNIVLEGDSINNFANYFIGDKQLIEDELLNTFVLCLLEMMKEVYALDLTGAVLSRFIKTLNNDVVAFIIRETFGRSPSFWAMVPEDNLEDAVKFIFKGYEEEYASLIEKIMAYYNTAQIDLHERMISLNENGLDFYVFAKYGFPDYPIYKGSDNQSDGTTATVRQAFGGEYAPYGTVFSSKYIEKLENKEYLSPDLKVNAQSCLFPERTWFIKNLHHDPFPNVFNWLAINAMNDEAKVNDSPYYAQFQYFDGTAFTPIETTDSDADKKKTNIFEVFYRFMNAMIKLFTRYIKDMFANAM